MTLSSLLIGAAALGAFYLLLVLAMMVAGRRRSVRALVRFLPDCVVAFRRMATDPAVPRRLKLVVLGLLAYLATPIDLIPDFIPVAGHLDDAVLVALVLAYIRRSGGVGLVRRHWPSAAPPGSVRSPEAGDVPPAAFASVSR